MPGPGKKNSKRALEAQFNRCVKQRTVADSTSTTIHHITPAGQYTQIHPLSKKEPTISIPPLAPPLESCDTAPNDEDLFPNPEKQDEPQTQVRSTLLYLKVTTDMPIDSAYHRWSYEDGK
jgi:hypothetical protein